MQEYLTNTSELKSIADSIRQRARISASLSYPEGFISGIQMIPSEPVYQNIEVTPLETAQTFYPASEFDAISVAHINAIPSDYVGSGIPRRSEITINGQSATISYGYYSESVTSQFPMATVNLNIPDQYQLASLISSDDIWSYPEGKVTVTYNCSFMISPTVSAGYLSEAITGNAILNTNLFIGLPTMSGSTIIPTESTQEVIARYKFLKGDVKLAAISSTYIGTQVSRLSAQTYTPGVSDMYIPAGYYLDGDQTILGDPNLIASNIKSGISIFGVNGTYIGIDGEISQFTAKDIIENRETCFVYSARGSNSRVSYIGEYTFASMSRVSGYWLSYSFPNCERIETGAFLNCKAISFISSGFFPNCKVIGSSAFAHCQSLTSCYFPSCEYICQGAFYSAGSLSYAIFTSNTNVQHVSYIGSSAFYSCSQLATINGISNCNYVGDSAFAWCRSLTNIRFNHCSEFGVSVFAYCSKLSSADIRYSISIIPSGLFYSCSVLSYYGYVFSSCREIGEYAFYSNRSLYSVNLSLCEKIEAHAFERCGNLSYINAPVCSYVGNRCFSYCDLTNFNFPALLFADEYAFVGNKLIDVNLPMCSYIGNYCFSGNGQIANVSVPVVEYIGVNVFSSTAIVSFYAPSCSYLGGSCFQRNFYLTYVDCPECTYIGNNCFQSCYSLLSVNFPKLSRVPGYAFEYCGLTSINLPSCNLVNAYAFRGCASLSSVNMPLCSSVYSYGFASCDSLLSIELPSCLNLSARAFDYCTNLSTVTLSVCSFIHGEAFYDCSNLLSVYLYYSSVVSINSWFTHINPNLKFFVPESLISLYSQARIWSDYISYLVPM